jgi:hypothetical protein
MDLAVLGIIEFVLKMVLYVVGIAAGMKYLCK